MKNFKFTINQNKIKEIVAKEGASELAMAARKRIESSVEIAHKILLGEFDDHLVTREIELGPNAPNLSGTLGGYGNLFSFFGFFEGDEPIAEVRNILQTRPRITIKTNGYICNFNVLGATKEEVFSSSEFSWSTRSWVQAVEEGLSGFGFYLYTNHAVDSRSEAAIQTKKQLRGGRYQNVKYMSEIFRNFSANIKKYL